jgi:hypothetical protein
MMRKKNKKRNKENEKKKEETGDYKKWFNKR